MTAHKRKESYFPELDGELQRLADEWFLDYLRLIRRIAVDARARSVHDTYPHSEVDRNSGTGKVRTRKTVEPPSNLPT
jgi:hypothetical protein